MVNGTSCHTLQAIGRSRFLNRFPALTVRLQKIEKRQNGTLDSPNIPITLDLTHHEMPQKPQV